MLKKWIFRIELKKKLILCIFTGRLTRIYRRPMRDLRMILLTQHSEAATRGVLQKNLSLKILQYSQENTNAEVTF